MLIDFLVALSTLLARPCSCVLIRSISASSSTLRNSVQYLPCFCCRRVSSSASEISVASLALLGSSFIMPVPVRPGRSSRCIVSASVVGLMRASSPACRSGECGACLRSAALAFGLAPSPAPRGHFWAVAMPASRWACPWLLEFLSADGLAATGLFSFD